jgi:hypothetical protein
MHPAILLSLLVAAPGTAAASSAAPTLPAIAIVFHLRPPASIDPALASADVALRAPEEIGEPLRAMRGHPAARIAFAVDPAYLAALDRAAAGDTALAHVVQGTSAAYGPKSSALLAILARHRPLSEAASKTPAGARYLTLATAASNELGGERSQPFSAADVADLAGTDAQVVVAASGLGAMAGIGAQKTDAVAALTRADSSIDDELKMDVRAGKVELIATPDGEPVLPLLIDAGGKSTADPHIVTVDARTDAQWLSNDAVREVAAFAQRSAVGFYSPYGAYDDATGALVHSAGAAYALFSDRVVRGAGGEGTEGGLDEANASPLRGYALTVERGVSLPVLFWSESESADIQDMVGSSGAMAERLAVLARGAADRARGTSPSIFVLRIEAQGAWAQRPDARSVVAQLIATAASGRAGNPTLPGAYLRAHPPTATAYGFPPAAESGSFALWMGDVEQESLWKALAAARKAAGGDAAFGRAQVRDLLIEVEAGDWYSSLAAPLPGGAIADRLDAFRSLVGSVYRAAGVSPPAVIAPMKLPPQATPQPSPSPTAPGH